MSDSDFSLALVWVRNGARIRRTSWVDIDYVVLMSGYPLGVPANGATAAAHRLERNKIVVVLPYFAARLRDSGPVITTWTPTTEDILAEDWSTVGAAVRQHAEGSGDDLGPVPG